VPVPLKATNPNDLSGGNYEPRDRWTASARAGALLPERREQPHPESPKNRVGVSVGAARSAQERPRTPSRYFQDRLAF